MDSVVESETGTNAVGYDKRSAGIPNLRRDEWYVGAPLVIPYGL